MNNHLTGELDIKTLITRKRKKHKPEITGFPVEAAREALFRVFSDGKVHATNKLADQEPFRSFTEPTAEELVGLSEDEIKWYRQRKRRFLYDIVGAMKLCGILEIQFTTRSAVYGATPLGLRIIECALKP